MGRDLGVARRRKGAIHAHFGPDSFAACNWIHWRRWYSVQDDQVLVQVSARCKGPQDLSLIEYIHIIIHDKNTLDSIVSRERRMQDGFGFAGFWIFDLDVSC